MAIPSDLAFASFLAAAEMSGQPLSEVFLVREAGESGKSRDELWSLMRERMAVMHSALNKGLTVPQHSRSGYIKGGAHRLREWSAKGGSLLCTSFTRLVAGAMAVAEVNACMGRIVAAPTAGSCGILPAALFTVAEEKGLTDEWVIRGLLTAGGLGLVIQEHATLSGAEGGCQAESGSASAMAAGGLVEMAGGTPEQVGHAAAFALKNLLGLICDPVSGLVEVPCVKRNALGAINAVAAAEMALAGLTSLFPLDQVIAAMGRVGKRMPEEFRETARGGLAAIGT